MQWQLAQANVMLLRAPLDSPALAGFVAALEPVNALADAQPGFVWRLQSEDGDATSIRVFDDDRILVNMSVWESIDALREFVYRTGHVDVMRHRREWAETLGEAHLVLWWVPGGQLPCVGDAEERLTALRTHGPTEYAFTFREAMDPPPSASTRRGLG